MAVTYGPVFDSDVREFVATTGATDIVVVNQLTNYLKAQNLWTSCRFFPFKSAQNKGSGTTVYGLGGWTSNNISLINGPTWGANGVAFDAIDDRGTWDGTGIEALSELYTFDRQKPTNASSPDVIKWGLLAIGDAFSRFVYAGGISGLLTGETFAAGLYNVSTSVNRRFGTNQSWSAGSDVQFVTLQNQASSNIWKSKATTTKVSPVGSDFRPLLAGISPGTVLDINSQLNTGVYTNFVSTTRVALLLCKTSLTQAQRETITDYLDAL